MAGRVPRCPKCGHRRAWRAHRIGLFERLLSVVYIYPFRCQVCARRFRALHRGGRSASSTDRREYERVPVRLPAVLQGGRSRAEGTTVDLSMDGCAIEVSGSFTAGDVVQVEISLTPGAGHVTTASGVVRSVASEMIGVHFQSMSAEDHQRLRRFMRDLLPAKPEVDTWDGASLGAPALNFWLAALILLFGVLAFIALMPSLSLCTWGLDC